MNHTTLNLSFTNIWGLCSNLAECESFLKSSSPDILALCETNNFSVKGYLSLIWKDSVTHMPGLAVYVKEGLTCAPYLFLENFVDSCFWLALLRPVCYFFFIYWSPSSLCMVFDSTPVSKNFTQIVQTFQWIYWAWAINCKCKEVFSTIAWAIYCPP